MMIEIGVKRTVAYISPSRNTKKSTLDFLLHLRTKTKPSFLKHVKLVAHDNNVNKSLVLLLLLLLLFCVSLPMVSETRENFWSAVKWNSSKVPFFCCLSVFTRTNNRSCIRRVLGNSYEKKDFDIFVCWFSENKTWSRFWTSVEHTTTHVTRKSASV